MIPFEKHILSNGLRVTVHRDRTTPLAAVHLIYRAGSRYDPQDRTGLAHLMEHMMFAGSENVPDFDTPQQLAGGENNAYTNPDVAHYYQILPAQHIETAFWLESDRLNALNLSERSVRTQKKVVVEEFNETCINQTFGLAWHHLYALAYQEHPYRWPTIGLSTDHIRSVSRQDVRKFYHRYYSPQNAALSVAGPLDPDEVFELVEKWFSDIERAGEPPGLPDAEPAQDGLRIKEIKGETPVSAIFMAFHMPGRSEQGYYTCDLISDILGNGSSSMLVSELQEEVEIFSHIDAYINGTADTGLLIIEGRPSHDIPVENALDSIWEVLGKLREVTISERELQKWQNQVDANLTFSNIGVGSKAGKLAYFDLHDDLDGVNGELERYRAISGRDIRHWARKILNVQNANLVLYS